MDCVVSTSSGARPEISGPGLVWVAFNSWASFLSSGISVRRVLLGLGNKCGADMIARKGRLAILRAGVADELGDLIQTLERQGLIAVEVCAFELHEDAHPVALFKKPLGLLHLGG